VLERATILSSGREIGPGVLDVAGTRPSLSAAVTEEPSPPSMASLDEVQRRHIRHVLAATGGRIYGPRGAARILGMKPSTLQSRMKKLGVGATAG